MQTKDELKIRAICVQGSIKRLLSEFWMDDMETPRVPLSETARWAGYYAAFTMLSHEEMLVRELTWHANI